MPKQNEFPMVFEQLKEILSPYAPKLAITTDTPAAYSLGGPYSGRWKKKLFFGSVQIKKNYVSFYLMAAYMYPELLQGISPELRKHMQGKSCFNFKKVEPALFEELASLTRAGYEAFQQEEQK